MRFFFFTKVNLLAETNNFLFIKSFNCIWQNDFAEVSKKAGYTIDLKTMLLNYQNNYVKHLNIDGHNIVKF